MLRDSVDAIYERTFSLLSDFMGMQPTAPLFYPNFIKESSAFLEVVANPIIIPKLWRLLGWNIYLYHAHIIVTPHVTDLTRDGLEWHQDSGHLNLDIQSHPRPMLSVKVGYFLSDVSEPGRGNMYVIPGSQELDVLPTAPSGATMPSGAIPILAAPGTAIMFDRRLWHSPSSNHSSTVRRAIFYGYGYRWLRTKDEMDVADLWPSVDPITRQLLGWGTCADAFYSPTDRDVPLRSWLKAHCPDDLTP